VSDETIIGPALTQSGLDSIGSNFWQYQADPESGLGSQPLFLKSDVFEVLYEGTRGPGKTDTLLVAFAQHCGQGYGASWRGIIFRKTYKQLGDVIQKSKRLFRMAFPAAKFNEGKSQWEWSTGETLLLRQFNRDDDYWNYHGHEYPFVAWEELCSWATDTGYKRLMSVCRSSNPNVPRMYRSTANPYGPGHNWVKARFQLPDMRFRIITDAVSPDGLPEPPRMAIFGVLDENHALLRADPEYKSRIVASARNESELRAWLYADWNIVAGGMFDDVWQPKHNVVRPFAIPASWRIDRGFDWGSSKPFSVGWWAESDGTEYIDTDGRKRQTVRGDLFRIAEWYGWRKGAANEGLKMLAVDIAKGILEREMTMKLHGRVKAGPADTSIFDAENGVCIATDMAKTVVINGQNFAGPQFLRADKSPGSRKTGWEAMRKMMKAAHPDPIGNPREAPGLFVFDTCVDGFLRTVPVLPRDDKDLDDVDTEAEDHVADEARYRVRNVGRHIGVGKVIGAR
jgi:hypothetical protein